MNALAISAWPSTTTFTRPNGAQAKMSVIVRLSARNCWYIGYENVARTFWFSALARGSRSRSSSSPCRCGRTTAAARASRGRDGHLTRSSPLTALKSAVFAPMPSASDSTTTAVQAFACQSMRAAWRRSLVMKF